jgi:hypothetical protein
LALDSLKTVVGDVKGTFCSHAGSQRTGSLGKKAVPSNLETSFTLTTYEHPRFDFLFSTKKKLRTPEELSSLFFLFSFFFFPSLFSLLFF